jgi:hypothetical protein
MAKYRTYRDPSLAHERDIPLSAAAELETHPAVIAAINAVASDARPPRAIWKAPTGSECDNIVLALEEYIYMKDFEPTQDGVYQWGADHIRI